MNKQRLRILYILLGVGIVVICAGVALLVMQSMLGANP